MIRNSNSGKCPSARQPGSCAAGPAVRYVAAVPLVGLALVLGGCASPDDSGSAANSSSPAPAQQQPSETAAPSDTPAAGTALEDLFRAEDPLSVEDYFLAEPRQRPDGLNLLVKESGTGSQTFDVPAMEPGSTFRTYLTCNQAEPYDVEFLDAEGTVVTSTGGDACNNQYLASYEYPVETDSMPVSVRVSGTESAEYWLVVYTTGSSN